MGETCLMQKSLFPDPVLPLLVDKLGLKHWEIYMGELNVLHQQALKQNNA